MIDAPLCAALAFARLGLAVVPVWPPMEKAGKFVCGCGKVDCKSPGKHPIARLGKSGPILAPNGVNSASTDSGIIKHWWQLAPLANIGVSTRNLIPLDIDARHDGLASLAALEEENGKLPPTWTVITGSVAPPSRHFTGGFYRWKVDGDPHEVPLGDAPGWMVERLTRTATKEKTRVATVSVEWAKLTGEAITEYHDAYAAKVAGKVVRAISIDPAFARGLLRAWNQTYCHPPLSDHELNQIFDRVATREAERLERINEGRAAGQ